MRIAKVVLRESVRQTDKLFSYVVDSSCLFCELLIGHYVFVPFGRIAPELGKKLLHEVIVLDSRTNVPILSIQPFNQDDYEYAVKIRTMNVQDHDDFPPMKLLEREANPSTPYYIRRLFESPDKKHRICGVFTTIPRW